MQLSLEAPFSLCSPSAARWWLLGLGAHLEQAAAFARHSFSPLEGSVPAGSLNEELEEALRKAREWGSQPAHASALRHSTLAELGTAKALLGVRERLGLDAAAEPCNSLFGCTSSVLRGP